LVICPNVENRTTALELGQRLARAVTANIVIGNQPVELRASVGVAWTDQPLAADAFVAQADAAIYESKQTPEPTARLWGLAFEATYNRGVGSVGKTSKRKRPSVEPGRQGQGVQYAVPKQPGDGGYVRHARTPARATR
jgi:GGDEF domain-containing protein